MKKAVFLFVTSEICPHCHDYIQNTEYGWPALKKKIQQMTNIELIEITNMTYSTKTLPNSLPQQIREAYVQFYPCFILVPHQNYKIGSADLQGSVYGCTWNEKAKQMVQNFSVPEFKPDQILKWIDLCLLESKFNAKTEVKTDVKTDGATDEVPTEKREQEISFRSTNGG